jgi:hypothetical protein
MVLWQRSALAFVHGWKADVAACLVPKWLVMPAMTLLRKSLPLSDTMAAGTPKLQTHGGFFVVGGHQLCVLAEHFIGFHDDVLPKASVITILY